MNWVEIYNTARRALFNAGEIVRKSWALHFDPVPRNVQVSFYDEHGELKTTTVPNLSKIKQHIWDDAQSAMYKIVYVDQSKGSDNNEGSKNSPFKSIVRAVSSVPPGGSVKVILLSDYEVSRDYPNSRESLTGGRYIRIVGKLNSDGTPMFTIRNTNRTRNSGFLIGSGTCVELYDIILESNDNGSNAPHWKMLFKTEIGATGFSLKIGRYAPTNSVKIILNDVPLADFELAVGEVNFEFINVNAPNHDSNNKLELFLYRTNKKVLFNYVGISVENDSVAIPDPGVI